MAPLRAWKYVAVFLATLIAADVAYAKGTSSKSSGSSHSASKSGSVSVKSYTRKDGTTVQAHHRSAPDGIFSNNWSTKGNVNPYTGKVGTISHPPDGYGSSRRYTSSISPSSLGPVDQSAMNEINESTTNASMMQRPVADQLFGDSEQVEQADDSSPYPQQPPKVVPKPIKWAPRIKWATDNMTTGEKAEHARVSEFLKSHKVNLVYWDKYSLDKLHAMEEQLIMEGHVDY